MTRAALLPTPADPFLIHYWLKFFKNGWDQYVDKLYVYVNAPTEPEVINFIIQELTSHPKIEYIYNTVQTDHGIALKELLDICHEELVMFIEDDGFIFVPDYVDFCFKRIESGEFDIVASRRDSCHLELVEAVRGYFNLSDFYGEGEHGVNFFPNFFFTKTDLLRATDGNFCGKAWSKGDVIEPLGNYVVQNDIIYSDTFVWGSIQLRALVPDHRILYVRQDHGHPSDPDFYEQQKWLFDGYAKWTHAGSLSSGICGVIRDDRNRPLAYRTVKEPEDHTILPLEWCSTDMEKGEWERRICFWEMAHDYFMGTEREGQDSPIIAFAEDYKTGLNNIIRQYGLRRKSIDRRKNIYRSLGL